MSKASTPTSPGFLTSSSSSYELDLPPLPGGPVLPPPDQHPPTTLPLTQGNSTKGTRNTSKAKAESPKTPVYGNVIRKSAKSAPQLSSQAGAGANIPLGTIMEAGDSDSTSDESEADFTDNTPIYTNSLDLLVEKEAEEEEEEEGEWGERQYTALRKSTRNSDTYNLYTIPEPIPAKKPHPPRHTSSQNKEEDGSGHVTNYVIVSDDGSNVAGSHHAPAPPLRFQSKRPSRWNIRDTFNRRYKMMKKVGMMSFCQSHSGAKKFFTVLTMAVVLLILGICGVVIATTSWRLLSGGMTEIQDRLKDHISAFQACRVGRNWTSVTINSSSVQGQCECMLQSDGACDCNISFSGFAQESPEDSQVLLYVIASVVPRSGGGDIAATQSFVNIALWTAHKDVGQTFREYLAMLNDPFSPQVVSRNIWFPYGDGTLFVKADILGDPLDQEGSGGGGVEELTVSVRTYLAGYC